MKRIFSILSAILLVISTAPVYRASAAVDVIKPVFESISVDHKDATAGDTVKVSVKASDDVGIGTVSLSYLTPVTKKAIPVPLKLNSQTNAYEGTIAIQNNFDSGSYTINALTITDTSNNTITLKSSTDPQKVAAGEFTVSGTIGTIVNDLQKPVFEGISVDKAKILTGNTINISVKASDNKGINFISLKYRTPANKEIQVSLTNNAETNAFEGKIALSNQAALGVYSVSYLSIVDLSGNTLNVNLDSESQKLASGAFKVVSELNPPVFTKLSIDQSLVASGDTVHFSVDATDETGLASGTLYVKAPKSQTKVAVPLQVDGTHFIGAFSIIGTTEEGNWIVDSLEIADTNDNVAVINAGKATLSTGNFTVKDITPPAKPVVNQVTDQDLAVNGSAEVGAKVDATANGTVIGSAVVGADGNFTVSIGKQTAGTELTVTATDAAGNVSDAASVIVKDVTAPAKPVVNQVTDKDLTVTGSAEAGAKVEVKAHGSVLGSTVAGADGTFTVAITKQAAGTELTVTATDTAGNVSDAASVIVKDVTAPAKPVVNQVTDKDLTVTGSAEAGAKVEVKAHGSALASAVAGSDGTFTVTIAKQAAGTELTVTATDAAGNVSDAASVIVKDVTAPAKPVVNQVTDKDLTVTGSAEAGAKVEVKAHGSVLGSTVAGADGTFTVAITKHAAGTELTVTATDAAGNVSDAASVVVKDVTAPAKPVVNQVTDKDLTVTGSAEAGAKVEVKAHGSVLASAVAGADGTFTVAIAKQAAGTELTVTATDVAGNVSEVTIMVVSKILSGWVQDNGTWYYYDPATLVIKAGWYQVNGTWYYANNSGAMQTGWIKLGTTWYYLNASGAMQTGWLKLGTTWYYLNASGAMQTGWLKLGTTWYYLNTSGAMQTGWVKDGASWYYLNANGAMQTGWVKDGASWYYLNANGAMQTGWVKLGTIWYYLNAKGAMVTGWEKINGNSYYFDQSGAWK
ncbi:Ig-like domain-containing protein [Neobacillus sp. NPDC097160]|uniref:Ig-like domain-containing protein n=1 Tax=Neobacillus sp. NPDC097160 TaxID=3364298 RepID=UPI0037F86BEE